MKREFVYFKSFEKNWKRIGLTEADIEELEGVLLENPDTGEVIQGTGGLRKMRFALPNRGKSGSTRILYVDFVSYEKTIFMNIYPKNEQVNITDRQKQEFKKLIDALLQQYRKNRS